MKKFLFLYELKVECPPPLNSCGTIKKCYLTEFVEYSKRILNIEYKKENITRIS